MADIKASSTYISALLNKNKAILEITACLLLVFGYTWIIYTTYLSFVHVVFYILIIALIIYSKKSHQESFYDLGFRFDNFIPAGKFLFLPFIVGMVILCIVWSFIFTIEPDFYKQGKFWTKLFFYPLWALFQQYFVLAFFFRRLKEAFNGSAFPAILFSATIFSAIHIPNPPLVILTFLAGLLWAWAYHRYPNIFTVALCHGITGSICSCFLLMYSTVGPFADINRWSKTSPVDYSLDKINGKTPTSKSNLIEIKKQAKNIFINGWAKGVDGKIGKIFVRLNNQDYPVDYGFPRKDVADYYKSQEYLKTGFQTKIPVLHLQPGYYSLRIKIKLSNRNTFVYSGLRVWLRIF